MAETKAWRYSINYGPDGEEDYANVYAPDGVLVGNLRTHDAIAIVSAMNAAAPAPSSADLGVLPDLSWLTAMTDDEMDLLRAHMPDDLRDRLRAALATLEAQAADPAPVSVAVEPVGDPDGWYINKALHSIRSRGWMVAVHNDYRLNGEAHTFWLFTKDGHAVKGEGRNDAEALAHVIAGIHAIEFPPIAEADVLRAALEKAATRFDHCAQMIASGTNVRGTLRAEQSLKAQHYALEARAALNAERQP